MTKFPDYCDFLTQEKIDEEDREWRKERYFVQYALDLRVVMEEIQAATVLELGCGAGYLPQHAELSKQDYVGVDGNAKIIELARKNSPGYWFEQGNIRNLEAYRGFSLVTSFAVMKHFGLQDWPEMLRSMLACGKYGLIQIQTVEQGPSIETGLEFHHTFLSRVEVATVLDTMKRQVQRVVRKRWIIEGEQAEELLLIG